jgi:hypothetical protein
MYFTFNLSVIRCDAPSGWGLYFQDSTSYFQHSAGCFHTYIALLFWVLVTAILIYNKTYVKSYVKYGYHRWGKFILYFIWANLSLCSVTYIFYFLHLLYALCCRIYFILFGECWVNLTGEQYAISDGIYSHPIRNTNSPGLSNHISLSSGPDNGSTSNLSHINSTNTSDLQHQNDLSSLRADLISKKAEMMNIRESNNTPSRVVTLNECGIKLDSKSVGGDFGHYETLQSLRINNPYLFKRYPGVTNVDTLISYIG